MPIIPTFPPLPPAAISTHQVLVAGIMPDAAPRRAVRLAVQSGPVALACDLDLNAIVSLIEQLQTARAQLSGLTLGSNGVAGP